MNGYWSLPIVGIPGTIQDTDYPIEAYLSTCGKIEAGSKVEMVALDANDAGQQWERSADDDLGYFTLKNPMSGKYLHGMKGYMKFTIEGNASSFVYLNR